MLRKAFWERSGWSENAKLCFDREATKAFAASNGLRSPETLLTLDSITALPPLDELPSSFVLKPLEGWSSNGVFLVQDGRDITTQEPVTRSQILARVEELGTLIGQGFLVEEMVRNWDGRRGAPLDFKFYNFGRRTAYIDVVERNSLRSQKLNRHWFLNDRWLPLDRKVQRYQDHAKDAPPIPPFCDDLLHISQRLARQLRMFVRVDLYASDNGPVMGELTVNPHGGKGYTEDADLWLGSLWRGKTGA